ncbi:peptidase, partial [Gardnerella leopoldii]
LDDALDALKAAKQKITDGYKTDKSDLTAEAGKDSDFTKTPEYQNAQAKGDDASKQVLDDYKKALEDANKVLGDKNAMQKQVDDALKKLQDAKSKLSDGYKTDKSGLQSEADADAKFRDSVLFMIGMTEDIDAYNTALSEAKRVLADPNATQAEVDAALRKLQAAKYKINHPFGIGSGVGSGSGSGAAAGFETTDSQSASVDKTALRVEVNNSEADSSTASKANTAAARAYVNALAEAKRVLADTNATQAQVDAALRNLKNAKAAWRNASGNASGLAKTGAATGLFASLAAVFSGLGVAGVASRRRKHSNE